jgi:hypothetical protein
MPGKEDEKVQIARMPHHVVDLGEQTACTVHVILQGARSRRRKRRILAVYPPPKSSDDRGAVTTSWICIAARVCAQHTQVLNTSYGQWNR